MDRKLAMSHGYGCTKCILFIDNHIADAVANNMAAAEKISWRIYRLAKPVDGNQFPGRGAVL